MPGSSPTRTLAILIIALVTIATTTVSAEPGTVEVIDLSALKTVATVDVGSEAAGVDFYKTEKPK